MADGKIYITISDTRGGSGVGLSNGIVAPKSSEKSGGASAFNDLSSFVVHKVLSDTVSIVNNAANDVLDNIGTFTGSYILQTAVNIARQATATAVKTTTTIVGTALSGMNIGSVGGPVGMGVGAAIGVVLGGASVVVESLYESTISIGKSVATTSLSFIRNNYQLRQTRDRLGLGTTTSNSRTGE